MNKEQFKALFDQALETAAQNAEKKLNYPVPRLFKIEIHGLASSSRVFTKESAFEEIYLSPDLFYRIIDISIRRINKDFSTVYMVVSGHSPVPFKKTWNQPPGSGPFKQVIAAEMEVN